MLVRLLVAVLMLTGPLPVRFCTCAAATGCPSPSTEFSIPEPPQRSTGCGCERGATDKPAADTSTGQHRGAATNDAPVQHDRGCPAVNPRPTVSAVLTPAADLPADLGLGLFDPVELPSCNQSRAAFLARQFSPPLAVPLYLSLLSLRI